MSGLALSGWFALAGAGLLATGTAAAGEVRAGPPTDLSVTIYRAPHRASGSLLLDSLAGFALVSETRTISIPAGESRIRFEGVADGIDAASVILTGLPAQLLEKNRDARVLSPASLVAAAVGRRLQLVRTDPKSGRSVRIQGTLRSGPDGGVVFESEQGIEALRCSGAAETLSFEADTDLTAGPTLSARIRSPGPLTASVMLSYLARGFDWSANYVAELAADGSTMDVGAWVTLGNANSAGFAAAHTQVVAGRLNRESGEVEPIEVARPILAQCWPLGTTSDTSREQPTDLGSLGASYELMDAPAPAAMPKALAAARAAQLVQEEQLGDLKLYRVPERTTIASRELKQVRLLDRSAVPVELFYLAELAANEIIESTPARRTMRTRNDVGHHLGLPLPSGRVDSFEMHGEHPLLLSEAPLRDIALDEPFEIDLGGSANVRVAAVRERTERMGATDLALLPGVVHLRSAVLDDINRIEVSNAHEFPIAVEIRLRLADGSRLLAADHAVTTRDDRPLFALNIAPGEIATIRYRTEHASARAAPR